MLFVYSITKMTMSDDIGEHSAMCPLMADDTDAGMEAPATSLAPESGWRIAGFQCHAIQNGVFRSNLLALRFSLAALDR